MLSTPKPRLTLASGSQIRRLLLENAGFDIDAIPAMVDETLLRAAMEAENAPPRDIADGLAEHKARKIAAKHGQSPVLGCDQVLACGGVLFSKPESPEALREDLAKLSGQTHQLFSAAVLYENGEPVWRHVGIARLTMRSLSAGFIEDYVARNWDSIRHSVGGYKLEEEGVRLFTSIQGDYFTILGLPLLDLINFLTLRGDLPT
ncbi:Maf family protein [Poseidonocella sedimentorum]|uniref:Nucleoside triphosphate pyrophosphatase n=1 Tax=Poseidonocella sedimentorum TaxID=871652 RepID=A0A1I6D6J5_9RHOB|nr:Maf family protein [Poseidonocella sedimentorum]SFR01086.1 septum formation protein [Poseidonocella sedimentorum]